jgi:regulator of RNase E activity RraA
MAEPADTIRERLSRCYTGVVNDVMRAAGMTGFVLPSEIVALNPEDVLCGPAFTVSGRPAVGAEAHDTLIAWTGLLSGARPGFVWVSQPNDLSLAHMGELSAETLQARGVLGCLIDGAARDTAFILRLGFPCWRRFNTPRDVVGAWLPDGTDVDIVIGGVGIAPGDYLLGDRDGVIRIPVAEVDRVLREAEHAMGLENKVRAAILDGVDPREAYLRHGKF